MLDALPTPRSTLAVSYVRVLVWCKACRHQADADLPALISAGRGDTPLRSLRFLSSAQGFTGGGVQRYRAALPCIRITAWAIDGQPQSVGVPQQSRVIVLR
jgi:hypothetical protein